MVGGPGKTLECRKRSLLKEMKQYFGFMKFKANQDIQEEELAFQWKGVRNRSEESKRV